MTTRHRRARPSTPSTRATERPSRPTQPRAAGDLTAAALAVRWRRPGRRVGRVGRSLVSVTRCALALRSPSRGRPGPGGRRRSRRRRCRPSPHHAGKAPPSRTSAIAIHADRPSRKAATATSLAALSQAGAVPPDPAGLVGQAEAAGRRRGRAARSRAGRARPSRCGRTAWRRGRGRPGRSRWAGACRASRAGRWWRRR